MQDMWAEDQAEERQIAQERGQEGYLEARVLHRPIRVLPTLQPAITLEGFPIVMRVYS